MKLTIKHPIALGRHLPSTSNLGILQAFRGKISDSEAGAMWQLICCPDPSIAAGMVPVEFVKALPARLNEALGINSPDKATFWRTRSSRTAQSLTSFFGEVDAMKTCELHEHHQDISDFWKGGAPQTQEEILQALEMGFGQYKQRLTDPDFLPIGCTETWGEAQKRFAEAFKLINQTPYGIVCCHGRTLDALLPMLGIEPPKLNAGGLVSAGSWVVLRPDREPQWFLSGTL